MEEWSWDGSGYNACTYKPSLAYNPHYKVLCNECEKIVFTGHDFGFGKEYKYCNVSL